MVKKMFSTNVVKLLFTMLSSIIWLMSFSIFTDNVSANKIANPQDSIVSSFSVAPPITLNQQLDFNKSKANKDPQDPDKITYHEFHKNVTDKPRIITKKSHHSIINWLEFLMIIILIISSLVFTILKIRKEYHQQRYTKKDPAH